jgi:hypothetical protein
LGVEATPVVVVVVVVVVVEEEEEEEEVVVEDVDPPLGLGATTAVRVAPSGPYASP